MGARAGRGGRDEGGGKISPAKCIFALKIEKESQKYYSIYAASFWVALQGVLAHSWIKHLLEKKAFMLKGAGWKSLVFSVFETARFWVYLRILCSFFSCSTGWPSWPRRGRRGPKRRRRRPRRWPTSSNDSAGSEEEVRTCKQLPVSFMHPSI